MVRGENQWHRRRIAGSDLIAVRPALVLLHRYVDLVMAGFLLIAGLTGSLLAWQEELEAVLSPQLFRVAPPAPDAEALDPLVLRAHIAERYPKARILRAPLEVEAGRGDPDELSNDQVFVNPYTAEVLGERKWGEISQGIENLMPFLYQLHYSLTLGTLGSYAFGIIALLWTLDCLVGAYLTFPARQRKDNASDPQPFRQRRRGERKSWLVRWWPS